MPYPVFPPPPPAAVEAPLYSVDNANHVDHSPNDSDVQGVDGSSRHFQGDRPQVAETSESEHWPSLLASPDVFLSEFSRHASVQDGGVHLSDYDPGNADASLLGTHLSIKDSDSQHSAQGSLSSDPVALDAENWRSLEPSLTSQSPGTTLPLGELDTLSIQPMRPGSSLPMLQETAVGFESAAHSSTPVQDVVTLLQRIPQDVNSSTAASSLASPSSSSAASVDESSELSETVVLNSATINNAADLTPEQAQRARQISDDVKQVDPQLLQPLDTAFDELYRFAQQAEDNQLQEGFVEERPADSNGGDLLDNVPPLDDSELEDSLPDSPVSDDPVIEDPTLDDSMLDDPMLENEAGTESPNRDQRQELIIPSPETLPDAEPIAPDAQAVPLEGAGQGDAIELTSDRQIYDTQRRVFIAEGNVEMRVRGSILNADRVQVNLPNKIAVAQGDVFFTRGEQVLRGDRIEYNLVSEEGTVFEARGEIFLPGVSSDLQATRTDADARSDAPPLSDQLARDQPPLETATSVGGINIGASAGSQGGLQGGAGGGEVRQIRFEAGTINFFPDGWEATNVRITNDPFSPPELELRTSRATFRRLSPTRSELITRRPRLVFDQGLSIPLFRRRYVFDENRRNSALVQFGFDEDDRGGLFIEREFEIITNPIARFTVRPQFFAQRAFDREDDDDGGEFSFADAFGVIANLDITIDQRTSIDSRVELTSFDLSDFEDEGRGSVRVNRLVLPINLPYSNRVGFHTLTAEYSYRDRLFNGTLGFQTVQETYGLVFTSPRIRLTQDDNFNQGIDLTYQAAIQRIDANVAPERRLDLLGDPPFDSVRTTLTRYQVAAELRRNFIVWRGVPLPATPEEGLKYTPNPVVPFISIIPRVQGVASFYSNGDTQPILTGEITLRGQFGHFSRPYLDYFGFSLSYRRSTEGSESPFTFDRLNDREVVTGSLTTQLFGPFRVGFRTSISLDEDEEFDNSFFLEYSRRTYGIILSYNPDREIGSLGFRLSDFTYTGTPEPFDGAEPTTDSAEADGLENGTDADDDLTTDPETSTPESGTIEVVPVDELETEPVTPNLPLKPSDSPPVDSSTPDSSTLDLSSPDSDLLESEDVPSFEENTSSSNADRFHVADRSDTLDLEPLAVNPFPSLESLELELASTQLADFVSPQSSTARSELLRHQPSPIPTWPGMLSDAVTNRLSAFDEGLDNDRVDNKSHLSMLSEGRYMLRIGEPTPTPISTRSSPAIQFTVRGPVTPYQHGPIPAWPGF